MHEAADYKSRNRTTGKMQTRPLLHIKVPGQAALSEEVCRKLNRTAETCPDHGGANTTVNTLEAFTIVNFAQAIERVLVIVLSSYGEERRVGLQARFNQEERRSGCSTNDARGSTGEHICSKGLYFGIIVDGRCEVGADGLVETQAAAIEQDLIDVL